MIMKETILRQIDDLLGGKHTMGDVEDLIDVIDLKAMGVRKPNSYGCMCSKSNRRNFLADLRKGVMTNMA